MRGISLVQVFPIIKKRTSCDLNRKTTSTPANEGASIQRRERSCQAAYNALLCVWIQYNASEDRNLRISRHVTYIFIY